MLSRKMLIILGVALLVLGMAAGGAIVALYRSSDAGITEADAPASPTAVATQFPPKVFGKWTLRCVLPPKGSKACGLILQLADKTRKHLLLRLAVTKDENGKTIFAVVTPPNALLANGVSLAPDKMPIQKLDFTVCNRGLCRAVHDLDAGLANSIASAKILTVSFSNAAGKQVSYPVPVDGFGDGLAAFKAQ